MKKTINVNISGIAFIIDEDAYQMLDSYLQEIESRLNSYEDDSDTLRDIEARIAEIFRENERGSHFVVNTELVKHVITVIGNPSIFGGHNFDGNPHHHINIKRITRRKDDRVIAGVCSGFADYFKVDVTIFRIIFAVLFIMSWGIWSIVYIIMWIVIPERGDNDTMFKRMENFKDKFKNR